MRNRWQLFTSNLIVFSLWYVLIYILTAGPGAALGALGGALLALAAGLIAGVIVGTAAHAVDLHLTHRGVRAGDTRDGARVTLGKLPERAALRSASPPSLPAAPAGLPPTANADEPSASADIPAKPATSRVSLPPADRADVPPAANAGGTPASADRLSACCAKFARRHSTVKVTLAASGSGHTGSIDRAASPEDFSDFLALVCALVAEGADVSAVAVTQDAGGVPVSVTFPISDTEKELPA